MASYAARDASWAMHKSRHGMSNPLGPKSTL
eukprot:CAMPEP_0194531448 /NCGR_PEP_ID=MMETSP0253-20130528/68746_1 /TAXON_ID=2966 /ORGANISM="Noctiluca scintillans" /LENGTH=30 /DNA_ID= /DNA_START= /DNA_END= /DNA_ORIENTATION=